MVVLHALPDTKGIVTLLDDLNVLFPIKRSYTFFVPVETSQNVIWLQFGPDMKWNSERERSSPSASLAYDPVDTQGSLTWDSPYRWSLGDRRLE
jgi:hypothetical protein